MKKALLLYLTFPLGIIAMDTYEKSLNSIGKAICEERLNLQAVEEFFEGHGVEQKKLELLESMVYRVQRIVFERADTLTNNLTADTLPAAKSSLTDLLFIGKAAALLLNNREYQPKDRDNLEQLLTLSQENINSFTDLARAKAEEERINALAEESLIEEVKTDTETISSLFSSLFSIKGLALVTAGYFLYRYTQRPTKSQTP